MEFEFVSKGFIYRKGRIKVTVSKVFKQGSGDNLEPVSNSHMVEMSVLATSGSDQVKNNCMYNNNLQYSNVIRFYYSIIHAVTICTDTT